MFVKSITSGSFRATVQSQHVPTTKDAGVVDIAFDVAIWKVN